MLNIYSSIKWPIFATWFIDKNHTSTESKIVIKMLILWGKKWRLSLFTPRIPVLMKHLTMYTLQYSWTVEPYLNGNFNNSSKKPIKAVGETVHCHSGVQFEWGAQQFCHPITNDLVSLFSLIFFSFKKILFQFLQNETNIQRVTYRTNMSLLVTTYGVMQLMC